MAERRCPGFFSAARGTSARVAEAAAAQLQLARALGKLTELPDEPHSSFRDRGGLLSLVALLHA